MPIAKGRKRKGVSQSSHKPKGIVKRPAKPRKSETTDQQAARYVKESRDRMARVDPSALDSEGILDWVTHGCGDAAPFIATAARLPKHLPEGSYLHNDDHDSRLNASYTVHPHNVWEHLRRYKKFTIGDAARGTDMSAGPGDYIMVKNDDTPEESTLERENQWKAQVLEIRALDGEHVYIRVAWLNRPEDLASGRKAHHGQHELIPTNQMDIIDAMTVNGTLTVSKWDENADDDSPDNELYYWRQTLDTVNGKTPTFSPLRRICIDRAPINPDEMIIQCDDPECNYWMHWECIAKDAIHSPTTEKIISSPEISYNDDELNEAASKKHYDKEERRTAHILLRKDGRKRNIVVVTDDSGQRTARQLLCLRCEAPIQ